MYVVCTGEYIHAEAYDYTLLHAYCYLTSLSLSIHHHLETSDYRLFYPLSSSTFPSLSIHHHHYQAEPPYYPLFYSFPSFTPYLFPFTITTTSTLRLLTIHYAILHLSFSLVCLSIHHHHYHTLRLLTMHYSIPPFSFAPVSISIHHHHHYHHTETSDYPLLYPASSLSPYSSLSPLLP